MIPGIGLPARFPARLTSADRRANGPIPSPFAHRKSCMKLRHKIIGTAAVLPVMMTAPAMAEETTPPVVVEPGPVQPPAPVDPVDPIDPVDPVEPAPLDPPPSEPAPAEPAPVASTPAASVTPVVKRKRVGIRTSRGGVSMRTRGTRYTPMAAVYRLTQWARSGRSGYRNGCLRLVDDAYGISSGRTSTALRQWFRARSAGYGHKNRYAPIGAQLFWRTSNPAGHIATYIGRGLVVTNVGSGRVKIVSWRTLDRWGPYLGWAEPYYGRA